MAERKEKIALEFTAAGAKVAGRDVAELGRQLKQLADESRKLNGGALPIGSGASIASALKGAGVTAGFHFATGAMRQMADVQRQFAEGTLTANQALMGYADAVPILGNVLRLIEGINAADNAIAEREKKAVAAVIKRGREMFEERNVSLVDPALRSIRALELAQSRYPDMVKARQENEAAGAAIEQRKRDITSKFGFSTFEHTADPELVGMLAPEVQAQLRTALEGLLADQALRDRAWNEALAKHRNALALGDTAKLGGAVKEGRALLASAWAGAGSLSEDFGSLMGRMREDIDESQRKQLRDFRSRARDLMRDGGGSSVRLPDLQDDRYSTGYRQRYEEERYADVAREQGRKMDRLIDEIHDLVRTLDRNNDGGFSAELMEVIEDLKRM